MSDPRRRLPAVGALLDSDDLAPILARHPRPLVTAAARDLLAAARDGAIAAPPDRAGWAMLIAGAVEARERPSLRGVINATGVILHTNLGRAPLPAAALAAMLDVASGFSNLEYDLDRGARGSRYDHCTALLRELTGAEDALVVNNCAAALVLALNTIADGRSAAISRGELVEIGGSFRIPDIMRRSGARMLEVGTTNRTHLADYRQALDDGAAAIVKVHRSNFTLEGFVAEVPLRELAALARERGLPLLHDFGSGLLLPLDEWGLHGEPTIHDVLDARPALVVMSGDKLLGGPQAGIVLGDAELMRRMRENPLARALRVDKLTIAALGATLALYRDPAHARRAVPALAMLAVPVDELRARAATLAASLADAAPAPQIVDSEASVGGGAFPSARLPSVALAFAGDVVTLERRLRLGEPAVIARVADDRLLLDLRAVLPDQDDALTRAVRAALS